MRKVVVARLSAGLLLTLGANAQANGLGSDSTGKDWVTAPADERSGWAKRTANIFNKDVPFADAVHGCLARALGAADDAEETLVSEIYESELTLITAACVTKLISPDAASE